MMLNVIHRSMTSYTLRDTNSWVLSYLLSHIPSLFSL